ncbi:MAG: ATP synthase F1 subunit gamma [Peptococcaceae bacterium]|jgi:F-type H+-transporting ATPase subunit gamma|nr:ATP synthase F1 subunit gamma [Peptococcaceae bacterium]
MSNLHEIQDRINSVKSTRKITRAMYLIAASKSQKAKAQLASTLPYFLEVASTLSEILAASAFIDTHFLAGREKRGASEKGGLYVVFGGDKGMAGGYNQRVIALMRERVDKASATVLAAGMTGKVRLSREGYRVDPDFFYPIMNPSIYRSRSIAGLVAERYLTGQYKEVGLIYTSVVSPIKQTPVFARLLPLHPEEFAEIGGVRPEAAKYNIIKYEPSAREVFDHLVPHYLNGIIYSALVEAYVSEQLARIYAMDNATKSADDMMASLALRFNRARQAKITQEISEIVGGIPES